MIAVEIRHAPGDFRYLDVDVFDAEVLVGTGMAYLGGGNIALCKADLRLRSWLTRCTQLGGTTKAWRQVVCNLVHQEFERKFGHRLCWADR